MENFTCDIRNNKNDFTRNADHWRTDENGVVTCSYCKCIQPECMKELIEKNGIDIVHLTRKPYLFTVHVFGKEYNYYKIHADDDFNQWFKNELYKMTSKWNS